MDIEDIDGTTIEKAGFKDKEFEQFFRRLLRAEREHRHRADARVLGPVTAYRGDEKRDLMFEVAGPPRRARTDFTEALTWDEVGRTWYSCKGGGSWRSSILTELGSAARNKSIKNGTNPGAARNRPPGKLLDHVENGGRYVFVVGVAAIDDRGLLDEAAKLLRFWLDFEERKIPPNLRAQLDFFDANSLADFIATHKPELSESQRAALQFEEPEGLKPWTQWTAELAAGRDLPEFQADAERQALLDAIGNSKNRVLRVFGPPGVGKTRVVHEGIRRCGAGAEAQTRYCEDFESSLRVVQDRWLHRGAKPWLVLDELRTIDAEQVTAKFEANASEGARLILVGTADSKARSVPNREFPISELGDEQTRTLIVNEAGGLSEEQRESIWKLSEGYPWYAVLLARAVSENDAILEQGDDDATRWSSGTLRVLAGNVEHYADAAQWEREAEIRAKALLVAILTRDLEMDWSELWERHGEGLRLAIDEPTQWNEVVRREQDCRGRQLLRQSGLRATRRYVSPNNLARLVLHHFLTDPDLGPKIRRHVPEFRSTLVAVAKAVQVNPALIEQLARGEMDELERRASVEGVAAVDAYLRFSEPCYEAAQDVPEHAAAVMARVVERTRMEELSSAGNLRSVGAFVFEHVVHRKISTAVFFAVEAALIALARVDDSPFSNNAEGIWKSLFLPGLHETHQTWEVRRTRLDERLADPDEFVRALAIEALGPAVDPREQGLGYSEVDKLDGDWPQVTESELLGRKAELWTRVLDACREDDRGLAARARLMVARQIRGAVGRGLEAERLAELTGEVACWTPEERHELLESLVDVRRYDMDDYAERPDLRDALSELEHAAAPLGLEDRVRAQIGSWHPGPWQITDPDREVHERTADLELARALLGDLGALQWALEWAASPQAHRANALWLALGRADQGASLLSRLTAVVAQGACAAGFGRYLLGWAEADSVKAVEDWLAVAPTTESLGLAEAAVWFLVFQSPSLTRLDWIRELIGSGAIIPQALALLAYRGWEQLDAKAVLAFMDAIVAVPELAELSLRLSVGVVERDRDPLTRELALGRLRVALPQVLARRVAIGVQDVATKASRFLAEAGDIEQVTSLILAALSVDLDNSRNTHLGNEMLKALLKEGYGEELWPQLAEALVGQQQSSLGWQLRRNNLLASVPEAAVMAWVGHDQQRGVVVAGLMTPHGEQLGFMARELLLRFGPLGPVGRELQRSARSPARAFAGGMEPFRRRLREHARAWQVEAPTPVVTWARELEETLDEQIREHEARAEYRAKYG